MKKILATFAALLLIGAGCASSSTTQTPAPTTEAKSYTLAEVATHKDATSCWAAIRGDVYDLTDWISKHPGGPERILGICGTDATQAFDAQHEGQGRPEATLVTFKIGTLQK